MTTPHNPHFTTQIVHADRLGGAEHGAIHQPVHTSVQYGFDKVEDLIAVFQGTAKGGFNYARQGTPTTAALEAKLTQMEQGQGAIVFSTGMAGICAIFLTLLKAGDHLVASKFVFGNTNSVFGTLADLGIEVTTVDVTDAAQVAAAVRPHTRMVFVETIANPGTQMPDLEGIGGEERPGVVHRLDKETSGLILLAKNERAHRWLQDQFRLRKVDKTYLALVDGKPPTPIGRVEAHIGRDPKDRKRMAIVSGKKGREAISEYKTLEEFDKHTLLEFHPLTGRTHQIRLHCAFLKCPIVGDRVYGRKNPSVEIGRHFLHAYRLNVVLPNEKEARHFEAPLPDELDSVLENLRSEK